MPQTQTTSTTIRKLTPSPGEIRARMGTLQREMTLLRTLKRLSEQARAASESRVLDPDPEAHPLTLDNLIVALQALRDKHGCDLEAFDSDGFPVTGVYARTATGRVEVSCWFVEEPNDERLRRMAAWAAADAAAEE